MSGEEREDRILEEEKLAEWDAGIHPDEEKLAAAAEAEAVNGPFDEDADLLEYFELMSAVLHACGKVAYYWFTLRNIQTGCYPVDEVMKEYGHSARYYIDKVNEWRDEARKRLETLKYFNYNDVSLPYADRDFLNMLVTEDRRRSYRETVSLGKKNKKFFGYDEFEARYQKRLENRRKKQQAT